MKTVNNSLFFEAEIAYQALKARDQRFDGVFFVGVTSTGIYCRPLCPAKTPQQKNCRFFATAEAAEKQGFRPCLRCRPELAPGNAPIDSAQQLIRLLLRHIEEAHVKDNMRIEEIAKLVGLSSRHLRRVVQKELGVSPIELLQTRRLLLAKQLLTETQLPITEVAFASGFSSLRRFNDAFSTHYKMSPTGLRKAGTKHEKISAADTSTLQLSYRHPFDWDSLLKFLSQRMIKGVEYINNQFYSRTVRIGTHVGWIKVVNIPEKHSLKVEFTHSLIPVLPALLSRLRNLFDLNARPDLISSQLMKDKRLKKSVINNPGLRVPGAFDGFEMAMRAILGQQITVKAATTLASRFAAILGETVSTPFPELTHLSPRPKYIAKKTIEELSKLGVTSARAKSISALARTYVSGDLQLELGINPQCMIEKLLTLPGIGQWTAQYLAMRALRWPDAFPKEDIGIRKALGGVTARQAEELSHAWRPWRSYAVMHLWKAL